MGHKYSSGDRNRGFTIIELVTVIAILSILLAMGSLGIQKMLPGYRLKKAAQDLYSNMQTAKMDAVKKNSDVTITFEEGNNRYIIDGTKVVSLSDIGSGVAIGSCDGSPAIGYADNTPVDTAIFTSRGLATQAEFEEWVYLKNSKSNCYKVGTTLTGLIKIQTAN